MIALVPLGLFDLRRYQPISIRTYQYLSFFLLDFHLQLFLATGGHPDRGYSLVPKLSKLHFET